VGPSGRPQLYSAESLVLLALLGDGGFQFGDPFIWHHRSMLHSLRTFV